MIDKIKRLFIVEDQSVSPAKVIDKGQPTEEISIPSVKSTTIPEGIIPEGAPDGKFIDILLGALDKNNKEGYDYLEYKQALQSLAKVGMDEATMYKSAIAMAGTLGATKDQILSSADHYMQVLGQEEAKFNQALNANKQKIALSEQNGITSLEQNIVSKQKQVENLLAEIEKEKLKLEELKNDIAGSALKIAQTAANFNAAYQLVAGQIADDVRKIKDYIN
jgi:hypothetical protein